MKQGKPAEGCLAIRVSADRDSMTIEVSDDGKGIDTGALREKAVRNGRLTQEAAAALTEAQALELIFMAGLTTRETVTDLSGRGVGMDVVRTNIEQLRGRVEIVSKPGEGTTMELVLPLTTAMLRVVEARTAGMSICLPTTSVDRVVAVEPGAQQTEITGAGGESEIVPLVPSGRYLPDIPMHTGAREAIVVRDHARAIGLLVDRVLDERPVLVTDLGGLVPRTEWVGACTLLADGRVAPIMDASALAAAFSGLEVVDDAPEASATPADQAPGVPTVLSVDDSPTMRQLMQNVLELAGYRVLLAEHGVAALEVLRKQLPDIVVCDVAMPVMDGLTLVREIRKEWPTLPVAIVSGRDKEQDRLAGIEAGADAYIVKGASDRRGLLSTVARLVHEGQEE